MHPTRQFETAVCGGSNLKAPMKLDFLRSLCAQERHAWPEVVLCRVEGEPLPVCCLSEAAAGDPFARIGIVTAPSEALTARAEYLLEQAVPEPIILRVFAEMFSLPEYPELVPDPPVRYVQADGSRACTCASSAARAAARTRSSRQ